MIAVTKFRGTYYLCEFDTEIYGGEVDAWDPAIRGDGKYLELKTSRIMQSHRQEQNFKRLVHLLTWKPRGDVQCQRLERGSEYTFIPRWFVDWEGWDKAQEKVV
nr:hypothetical protein BaRGS_021691 [Batillaria attramentaria]